jgi:outer membrane usher protein FimD/PapC
MRLNLSNNKHLLGLTQSLLSQSLSDLRSSPLAASSGAYYEHKSHRNNLMIKSSTPVRKKSSSSSSGAENNNNFNPDCDEELEELEDLLEESIISLPASITNNERLSRIASPDSMATMTPTSSQVIILF